MVTIQSQNFGVEIEMTGVSRGTAASVIANYFGVGGIHFAGGTYQTYEAKDSKGRVWKCMRDGSITPRRRRGGAIVEADDTYRCEVVTPILQYEDITDLQEVIRALVKKGAMANSSCGIHVHVDGANHTPESLCRLLNFATGRQDLFYEALQIGSRADHWCHKINPALFREMKKNGRASRNDAERIWYSVANDGYDGGVDSSHYNSTRYHGINLHAFFTKGTVEFRLFNGTTHAGRIKAYVQFCLAMSASRYSPSALLGKFWLPVQLFWARSYMMASSTHEMKSRSGLPGITVLPKNCSYPVTSSLSSSSMSVDTNS